MFDRNRIGTYISPTEQRIKETKVKYGGIGFVAALLLTWIF